MSLEIFPLNQIHPSAYGPAGPLQPEYYNFETLMATNHSKVQGFIM